MAQPPTQTIMRSTLGRARGLGAARSGTAHWWAERATSAALVPLTLWFVWSVVHLAGQPRAAVAHWASGTVNATLLLALVLVTFQHLVLGLQVVLEDYIHSEAKRLAAILAVKAAAGLLGLAAVIAVIKLALAG